MTTKALVEIMSSKPHKIRKQWLRDRVAKEKGVKFDKQSNNLEVSKMIDRLNDAVFVKKDEFSDSEDCFVVNQLSFDF